MDAVRLVPLQERHALELVAVADAEDVARWLSPGFPQPYRLADARAFIDAQRLHLRPLNFAIETPPAIEKPPPGDPAPEGTLVGTIGLRFEASRPDAPELGYLVGTRYRGRGYATLAIRQIVAYASGLATVSHVRASAMRPNHASIRALEKAGFRLEAIRPNAMLDRRGVAHDECDFILRLERGEARARPDQDCRPAD